MKSKPQQAPLFDSMLRLDADETEAFSFGDEMREETEGFGIVDFAERRETIVPPSSMQTSLRLVQQQLNDLHEELYRKGGIKPSNAAIDEVGKLIFLKVHAEQYSDYQLQSGAGKGKLFLDIFNAAYVRHNGKKAVRELQDAFQEISVLPSYLSEFNSDRQTLFPYREPLRLEHPDVLAMAIDILAPLSLFVSDDHLIANAQQQWETFSHQDLLGSAYDVFLRGKYDSSGGLGTYLTPSQVVDCMVKMAFSHMSDEQLWARQGELDGQLRQDIQRAPVLPAFLMGDICCGTGRFLVRSLAEVRNRILNSPNKSDNEKLDWLAQMKKHSFFGADQSAASIIKARINFLLFGEPHAQLLSVEDSILDERIDHLVGKFDLILTNPPFGEGKYVTPAGLEKMRRYDLGLQLGWSWKTGKKKEIQRADPALLFLDRNLQLLKPGGLLFIVLPDGILEPAYEYAHKYLLEKAAIKSVVSLPRDTFAIAGTVAKTSFLCLQKADERRQYRGAAFMAVADHVGFIKKGSTEIPDPKGDDLPFIAASYEEYIRANSLASRKVLSHDPMIVTIPQDALQDSLTAQTYHPDRLHAEQMASTMHKEARYLQDLVILRNPRPAMRTERTAYFISVLHVDEKSNVDWEAAKMYQPSSKGIYCHANDIIFSCLNPAKVRVAVIPSDIKGEVLCSMEFAVLHTKPGENPYFIALALRTSVSQRQILPLARGTSSSRRRVRDQDLLGITLPYPDVAIRQEIGTKFLEALEMARKAFSSNSKLLQQLESRSI